MKNNTITVKQKQTETISYNKLYYHIVFYVQFMAKDKKLMSSIVFVLFFVDFKRKNEFIVREVKDNVL